MLDRYIAKGILKDAQAKWAGQEEIAAFFAYMSSKEKKAAVRRATMLGTKKYRTKLKADTPKGSRPINGVKEYSNIGAGKRKRRLEDTIGVAESRKYNPPDDSQIRPFWAGHLVKRGAYHQHLIVRGTRKWTQNNTPLRRARKGGGKKRRKIMVFFGEEGLAIGRTRRRVKGKDYVAPVAAKFQDGIVNDFGNYFTTAMKKEARKPKYKKYLR